MNLDAVQDVLACVCVSLPLVTDATNLLLTIYTKQFVPYTPATVSFIYIVVSVDRLYYICVEIHVFYEETVVQMK